MNAPYLRLGSAGTWNGRRADVFRSLLLASAAAVVAIVAGGVLSAHRLSDAVGDRATGRALRPAPTGAAADAERASLFDETEDGEQIYLYWWRVHRPAMIHGITGPPRPDTWYVSPALLDRIGEDPLLRARYPNPRELDPSGVAAPAELLAHRVVGPEVALPDALMAGETDDWIGDVGETVDTFPLVFAALAFVVIPSIGLLLGACAPLRTSFDDRLEILRALGAPPGARRAATVVPILLTAAPGALVGAGLWWAVAGHLTAVPLVGTPVFRGDLGLPLHLGVGAAGVSIAAAVMVALAGVRTPREPSGPRPTAEIRSAPSVVRLVPLLAAVSTLVASASVGGKPGARVFLVGLLAAAVGAVVALPWLVERLGSALAGGRHVLSLLVGRRLAWDAVSSVRSLTALGSLLVLLPVVASWVDTNRSTDPVRPGDRYAVEIQGSSADATADSLARRAGAPALEVVSTEQGDPEPVLVVGDCADLATFGRCTADRRLEAVPGRGLEGLAGLLVIDDRPAGSVLESTFLLATDGPTVEALARSRVANGDDATLRASAPGRYPFRESRLVAWILGGARLAGVLSLLALGLHLVGGSARIGRSRTRLAALGATTTALRRLAGAEAGSIVALVGFGCEAIGAVAAQLFVLKGGATQLPTAALLASAGVIASLAASAALAAAIAAAPAGSPRHRR